MKSHLVGLCMCLRFLHLFGPLAQNLMHSTSSPPSMSERYSKTAKKKKYSGLKWCSVYSPYMSILESIHLLVIFLGKVPKLNLS